MNNDERKFALAEIRERITMKEFIKTEKWQQCIYTPIGSFNHQDGWWYSGGSQPVSMELKIRNNDSRDYNSVLMEGQKFDSMKEATNDGEFIYISFFNDKVYYHLVDTSLIYYKHYIKCNKTTAVDAPKKDKEVIFLDYKDAFFTGDTSTIDRDKIIEKSVNALNSRTN